jgi:hypothetical protein
MRSFIHKLQNLFSRLHASIRIVLDASTQATIVLLKTFQVSQQLFQISLQFFIGSFDLLIVVLVHLTFPLSFLFFLDKVASLELFSNDKILKL